MITKNRLKKIEEGLNVYEEKNKKRKGLMLMAAYEGSYIEKGYFKDEEEQDRFYFFLKDDTDFDNFTIDEEVIKEYIEEFKKLDGTGLRAKGRYLSTP